MIGPNDAAAADSEVTEPGAAVAWSADLDATKDRPRLRFAVVRKTGLAFGVELRCLAWPCPQTRGQKVGARFGLVSEGLQQSPHASEVRRAWAEAKLAEWRLILLMQFGLDLPRTITGRALADGLAAALESGR